MSCVSFIELRDLQELCEMLPFCLVIFRGTTWLLKGLSGNTKSWLVGWILHLKCTIIMTSKAPAWAEKVQKKCHQDHLPSIINYVSTNGHKVAWKPNSHMRASHWKFLKYTEGPFKKNVGCIKLNWWSYTFLTSGACLVIFNPDQPQVHETYDLTHTERDLLRFYSVGSLAPCSG